MGQMINLGKAHSFLGFLKHSGRCFEGFFRPRYCIGILESRYHHGLKALEQFFIEKAFLYFLLNLMVSVFHSNVQNLFVSILRSQHQL